MPRSRKVSCIRAYSPLRTIFDPSSSARFEPEDAGRRGPSCRRAASRRIRQRSPEMSSATWPRSRPSTPIVRSIDGWMLLCVISVGTVVRVTRRQRPERDRVGLQGAGDRDVEHRLERRDVLLGVRHADEVLVVALGVDPEVLLVEGDRRVQGRDDVPHHVFLGHPQVGGLGPVNVDDEFRVVLPLQNPGVDDAVDPRRPCP